MNFPVELTHPNRAEKTLHARDREELDSLLKLGWVAKTPYVVIDGKQVGKLIEAEASK